MRLEITNDIPQEIPRQQNQDAASEKESARRAPETPLDRYLKQRDEPTGDSRRDRQPDCSVERRRREPQQDVPRERRRPVSSGDSRRPPRSSGNVIGLELRPEEKQLLREAGRFRVVRTEDIRQSLYHGKDRTLENDLKFLREKGLIDTEQINLRRDGVRRSVESVQVITLTREGQRLLNKDSDLPKDQKVYSGLVKPREVEHDSQIYRAYQKEAVQITERGGTNLRVKLDFELKADIQKDIYRARKEDPSREMTAIKQEVAEKHELPFINGSIQIPDARIEFELPRRENDLDQGSRSGHQDIEVLTAAYHAGHLRSKAQAGFHNYASPSDRSSITARIENDHGMMEGIFDL